MKPSTRTIFLLAAFAFMPFAAFAGRTPQQMIDSAKDVDRRFCEAFSKGDVDGILATYWNSPDLVVYPPDAMEQHGWQAVKEAYKNFGPGTKLELIEPHYMVAGDVVLGWGRWKLTMTGKDGKPIEVPGRYTCVMAEKDGKWVYIIDHPSVPLMPQAPK